MIGWYNSSSAQLRIVAEKIANKFISTVFNAWLKYNQTLYEKVGHISLGYVVLVKHCILSVYCLYTARILPYILTVYVIPIYCLYIACVMPAYCLHTVCIHLLCSMMLEMGLLGVEESTLFK